VPSQTRPLVSDDPVDLARLGLLYDHPVGVVEPDGAARPEIVDAELCTGLTLRGGSKGREEEHVGRLLVQELGEATLEVVVGGDVVEDGLVGLEGRRVAPPTERLRLGKAEVRLVELDRTPLDRQLGDLATQVLAMPSCVASERSGSWPSAWR